MSKLGSVILVFIALWSQVHAQNSASELSWSETNKLDRDIYSRSFLGFVEGHFAEVIYKDLDEFNNLSTFLNLYDSSSLALVKTMPLKQSLPEDFPYKLQSIKILNNNINVFLSQYNYKLRTTRIFIREFNVINDTNHLRKLTEYTSFYGIAERELNIAKSANSKTIGVCIKNSGDDEFHQKLTFKVFSNSFDSLWEKEIMLPYDEREIEIIDFKITNNQQPIILAKVTNKNYSFKKGRPNFKYIVIIVDKQNNELNEFEVSFYNKSISDAQIVLNQQEQLEIFGFYSNIARSESELGGLYYLRINPENQQITHRVNTNFSNELLRNFLNDKQMLKGKELEDYTIKHVLHHSDTLSLLIAEQSFDRPSCVPDPHTGELNCTDHYYATNIIVWGINLQNNQILWNTVIPKKQYSTDDQGLFSSFVVVPTNNGADFYYNDHIKNMPNSEKLRYFTSITKSALYQISLNTKGEYEKIYNKKIQDKAQHLLPALYYYSPQQKQLIIYGQGRKFYKLGRIQTQ